MPILCNRDATLAGRAGLLLQLDLLPRVPRRGAIVRGGHEFHGIVKDIGQVVGSWGHMVLARAALGRQRRAGEAMARWSGRMVVVVVRRACKERRGRHWHLELLVLPGGERGVCRHVYGGESQNCRRNDCNVDTLSEGGGRQERTSVKKLSAVFVAETKRISPWFCDEEVAFRDVWLWSPSFPRRPRRLSDRPTSHQPQGRASTLYCSSPCSEITASEECNTFLYDGVIYTSCCFSCANCFVNNASSSRQLMTGQEVSRMSNVACWAVLEAFSCSAEGVLICSLLVRNGKT
jgi:hypothetical protein